MTQRILDRVDPRYTCIIPSCGAPATRTLRVTPGGEDAGVGFCDSCTTALNGELPPVPQPKKVAKTGVWKGYMWCVDGGSIWRHSNGRWMASVFPVLTAADFAFLTDLFTHQGDTFPTEGL